LWYKDYGEDAGKGEIPEAIESSLCQSMMGG